MDSLQESKMKKRAARFKTAFNIIKIESIRRENSFFSISDGITGIYTKCYYTMLQWAIDMSKWRIGKEKNPPPGKEFPW